MRTRWLPLLFLTSLLAACGSGSNAGAQSCEPAFSAPVTAGPDQGTLLFGTLRIDPISATEWSGYLDPYVPASGQQMLPMQITQRTNATATISGDTLTLTFTLSDGRTITGTGALPAGGSPCATGSEKITGTLAGPAAGDTGNWAIEASITVCVHSICGSVTEGGCPDGIGNCS